MRLRTFVVTAGAAVVAVSLGLVVLLSGEDDSAERITFSDFEGGLLGLGEVDNRQFFGTCPRGRVKVEFTPDDQIRITTAGGELVASLDVEAASVGCAGGLEDTRGRGFYVRGLTRTGRAAELECVSDRPLVLLVHPIFRYESDVYGGSVVLGTPVRNLPPRALIISSFTEDGRSDVYYRSESCRISRR